MKYSTFILVILSALLSAKERKLPEILRTSGTIFISDENMLIRDSVIDAFPRYVVVRETRLNLQPNEMINLSHHTASSIYPGRIVGKITDPIYDAPEPLIPIVTYRRKKAYRRWIPADAIVPFTSYDQLTLFTPSDQTVNNNFFTGLALKDTALMTWAIENGVDLLKSSSSSPLYKAAETLDSSLFAFVLAASKKQLEEKREELSSRKVTTCEQLIQSSIFTFLLKTEQYDKLRAHIATLPNALRYEKKLKSHLSRAPIPEPVGTDYDSYLSLLDSLGTDSYPKTIQLTVTRNDTTLYKLIRPKLTPGEFEKISKEVFSRSLTPENRAIYHYLVDHESPIPSDIFTRSLIFSVHSKDPDQVKWLIDQGGDVNGYIPRGDSLSPLQQLCKIHRSVRPRKFNDSLCDVVAEVLLENGADIHTTYRKHSWKPTVLHSAAEWGSPELLEVLLNHDADINELTIKHEPTWVGHSGRVASIATPLNLALYYGNYEGGRFLIDQGAELFNQSVQPEELFSIESDDWRKTAKGFNVLNDIAVTNNVALFEELAKSAPVDSSHLLRAAYHGNDSIVAFLLKNYPQLNGTYRDSTKEGVFEGSALDAAIWGSVYGPRVYYYDSTRYNRIVEMLLEAGYDPTSKVIFKGKSIEHTDAAALKGRFDLVNILYKQGAPLGAQVLKESMKLPNPAVNQTYTDLFIASHDRLNYNALCELIQTSKGDSIAHDRFRNLYRKQVGRKMPRKLYKEVKVDKKEHSGQMMSVDSVSRVLHYMLSFYEKTVSSTRQRYYIGRKDFPANIAVPEKLLHVPLFLNEKSEANTWFRHYNPFLIDGITKSLDIPLLKDAVISANKSLYFDTPYCREDKIDDIMKLFLKEYVRLDKTEEGNVSLKLYEEYFRDPVERFSGIGLFPGSDNYLVTGFWIRRKLDGTAELFRDLFAKVLEVIQED